MKVVIRLGLFVTFQTAVAVKHYERCSRLARSLLKYDSERHALMTNDFIPHSL